VPFDPQDLGDLIAIRDAGTLSAAAKARGVAVSTVSRRIETLETALGLQLVDRRTGGVRLTRDGLAVAEAAAPIAEQMRRVERMAESLRQGGKTVPVRISATEFVISDVLAPALDRLWAMGAEFPVHLHSQADVVSLAGRDADLAIRMVRPEGASLYARKLADLRLGLFASAGYLAGREPAEINLQDERLLVYDNSYGRLPELDWVVRHGLTDAVAMRTGSTRGQHPRAARRGARGCGYRAAAGGFRPAHRGAGRNPAALCLVEPPAVADRAPRPARIACDQARSEVGY
jgi:DNA-binding transcriptional LysR family regulator